MIQKYDYNAQELKHLVNVFKFFFARNKVDTSYCKNFIIRSLNFLLGVVYLVKNSDKVPFGEPSSSDAQVL